MPGRLEHRAAHAAVQWQNVEESVLAGVCHTLNSRITALWGVAELLSADAASESLMALFRAELQRLEQLARLLHWLPRRPGRGAEPISLAELLPELVELHREHHGLDRIRVELEGDPGTPAILVDPAALCRGVLLLLAAAGRAVPARAGRVAAAYGPAGAAAALTIRAYGAGQAGDGEGGPPELEAARHILGGAAEISVSHGGDGPDAALSFEVRFPAA